MYGKWIVLGGLALIVFGAAFVFFAPTAKLQRRRRKSHGRIVTKSNRPMVRLSVRPPKE